MNDKSTEKPRRSKPIDPAQPPRKKKTKTAASPISDEIKEASDDPDGVTIIQKILTKGNWKNMSSAGVSLLFHVIVLLIIAFLTLPPTTRSQFSLFLKTSDSIDENFDQVFEISDTTDFSPSLNPDDFQKSDEGDPQLFEPKLTKFETNLPSLPTPKSNPSFALSGRGERGRMGMLARFGGTKETEDAVELGLKWLAKNQRRDGSWSLKEPYRSQVAEENSMAATGLALLAFLGHGDTHQKGDFQKVVDRGVQALIKNQSANGHFVERRASLSHSMYSHAICSIAICELLAMTQDEALIGPAREAIQFAVDAQSPQGGWKYEIKDEKSDLSVTGWFIMLFQSAKYAGIEYEESVLTRAQTFVDNVMLPDGSQFRYQPDHEPSLAMTAEGFLCQQYLGWKKDDARLVAGAEYLLKNPIRWSQKNVYYWYYATQVMRHMDDDNWKKWNDEMLKVLPVKQLKSGVDTGSWDPHGDPYGGPGGRLYTTCLCIYCLEVYYRHLPIYQMPDRN